MQEIFHSSWRVNGRDYTVEDVLRDGLKSKKRLIEEGQWTGSVPQTDFEKWRAGLVYFVLENPGRTWFSLMVDPTEVKVGNINLEQSPEAYKQSIMTLDQYLQRQSGSRILHPITAEPMAKEQSFSFPFPKFGDDIQLPVSKYRVEVLIEEEVIPGSRIHRYNVGYK